MRLIILTWRFGPQLTLLGRIWVCFFMLALQSAIGNNVIFFAYSSFQNAPQVSTANIVASIVGGVLKLPIAKVLNVWGRAEGFLVFLGIYLLGIIVIASSDGPNAYAAGYALYWIGYDALYFILDVFVADTSGLRNRALSFGFVSTPFICTAFTGPLAAQAFIKGSTWRWGYGAFAIIMPCFLIPVALIFKFYQRKAERMGVFVNQSSGRTKLQSLKHYIHEFDGKSIIIVLKRLHCSPLIPVIGALILTAAFLLFLLPFSLQQYGRAQYASGTFIAMLVVGFCLFFVFAAWEKYLARVHFIRWELFKQRTVLGACAMAAILFFSFYSWDLYYNYFVRVVYDLSISDAGYMTQVYNVGSTFVGAVFGIYVRWAKRFKYACLFFALPLLSLGAGLMIKFRGQEGSLGYLIMCQIFIAFGGGTIVIGEQMAAMAAADRDGVPLMLSLVGLSSSVGGAIGQAVSAAINSNIFPNALASRLPEAERGNTTTIFLGGTNTQLTYPVGSPERDAINYAWTRSQYYSSISATAVLVLAIPAIAAWKNYHVGKQQNKGTVI